MATYFAMITWMGVINLWAGIALVLIFCDAEIHVLKHLKPTVMKGKDKPTASGCLNAVARLGGYVSRRGDPPPRNTVLWRGFKRLIGIHLGFALGDGRT